ncbi:MAG: LacI family DNA-binding transcriptional regulator [Chloroflexota bacterium]
MPTIQDVADRAQVSKSTVSYAFNKPHLVSAQTLDRILTAAREINYQPNIFAQGLAGGRTQMIGLLLPDIRYPYNATIARGIEDRLRKEGYIVVTSSTGGDTEEIITLLGQLHRRGVSGFILVPSYFGFNPRLIQTIEAMAVGKIPIVVAGYETDNQQILQVTNRPKAGAIEAVNHLIALGHRDIAYLGAHHSEGNAIFRFLGYQASHVKAGLPMRPELIIETAINPQQLSNDLAALFELASPPTAIFSLNDVVTCAILDFCYRRQIQIPEDLSVVSFDYQALVQRQTPGITSVVVPVYEVGKLAAELLLERLNDPASQVRQIELAYTFELRDSTRPPQKKS